MKKAGKYIICSVLALCFAAGLFYCLVAGAPQPDSGRLEWYLLWALCFSVLTGGLLAGAFCHIHTLQKKVNQLQERLKNRKDP